MKKFELVFIPGTGAGHLTAAVEMANILVTRDERLSVTMLIHKLPLDTNTPQAVQSLSAAFAGKSIRFILLPELPPPHDTRKSHYLLHALHITERYKPHVREAVAKLIDSSQLVVGFVVDMFCTTMIDVAKQFGVPCYVFYTSNAGCLALHFALQELYDRNNGGDHQAVEEFMNCDAESLVVPGFVNPIPTELFSRVFSNYEFAVWFCVNTKRFRSEIEGILINTFVEMESQLLNAIESLVPSLYSVGPILHLKNTGCAESPPDVLKWLDDQPPSSVVFLCFGGMGSFDECQVGEIARALERSGVRFVWSLRQPPSKGNFAVPRDFAVADIAGVLPEGFLDRTVGIGKVIGWAPQVEILAHPATGGFVSHCGWNSILESVWHGVPMAAWPMYAEQPFNAFELVVELGLGVEIAMDYHRDSPRLVSAEEIESGIRKLMEDNGGKIRKKVAAKSEESRKSLMEGGSSFISLGHFIDDVLASCNG